MWDFEIEQKKAEQRTDRVFWMVYLAFFIVAFGLLGGMLIQSISNLNDAIGHYDQERTPGFRSAHTYQAGR